MQLYDSVSRGTDSTTKHNKKKAHRGVEKSPSKVIQRGPVKPHLRIAMGILMFLSLNLFEPASKTSTELSYQMTTSRAMGVQSHTNCRGDVGATYICQQVHPCVTRVHSHMESGL